MTPYYYDDCDVDIKMYSRRNKFSRFMWNVERWNPRQLFRIQTFDVCKQWCNFIHKNNHMLCLQMTLSQFTYFETIYDCVVRMCFAQLFTHLVQQLRYFFGRFFSRLRGNKYRKQYIAQTHHSKKHYPSEQSGIFFHRRIQFSQNEYNSERQCNAGWIAIALDL